MRDRLLVLTSTALESLGGLVPKSAIVRPANIPDISRSG